jgi:hypothetical protein
MSEPTKPPHLDVLAAQAFKVAREFGTLTDDGREQDLSSFFAKLHVAVSNAYETYESGAPVNHLVYIDDAGEETTPDKGGIPNGLPADLAEVLLLVLAGSRLMGIPIDKVVTEVLASQTAFEGDDDIDDDDGEGGGVQ